MSIIDTLHTKNIAPEIQNLFDGRANCHYILPIKEIDGVSVIAKMILSDNGLSLLINSTAWMYDKQKLITLDGIIVRMHTLFKKTYLKKIGLGLEYTLKDIISVLELIDIDIVNLKFNKLDGFLYLKEDSSISHPKNQPYIKPKKYYYEIDEDRHYFPCDEFNPQECCVCLDMTKTTTPCGHKLCVSCWGRIKQNGRAFPCPLCRKNLTQREFVEHIAPNGWEGPDDIQDINEESYENVFDNDEDDNDDDFDFNDIIHEFPSISENSIYDFY